MGWEERVGGRENEPRRLSRWVSRGRMKEVSWASIQHSGRKWNYSKDKWSLAQCCASSIQRRQQAFGRLGSSRPQRQMLPSSALPPSLLPFCLSSLSHSRSVLAPTLFDIPESLTCIAMRALLPRVGAMMPARVPRNRIPDEAACVTVALKIENAIWPGR